MEAEYCFLNGTKNGFLVSFGLGDLETTAATIYLTNQEQKNKTEKKLRNKGES